MKINWFQIAMVFALTSFGACKKPSVNQPIEKEEIQAKTAELKEGKGFSILEKDAGDSSIKQITDNKVPDSAFVEKNHAQLIPVKEKVSNRKPKPKKVPKIFFEYPVLNFGTIEEGEVINHRFEFINRGNAPLSIKKTEVTCGCTVPSFPFLDVGPGEKGYIGVQFNSVGKMGKTTAEITVHSNASPPEIKLSLVGLVEQKEN